MKMPSVMGHQFSQVPKAEIQRSAFDRTYGYKTTLDAGYLVPFYVDEALPGDTFVMNMAAFARLATPLKPFMDNLFMETFFFLVTYRLVWNNWERFCGAQDDPNDSTDFTIPQMVTTAPTHTTGSLYDYMGLVPQNAAHIAQAYAHSALPIRAYNLIWNTWFRDQNLQNSVVVDLDDGPDTAADYVLLRRGKRHDYFTSCLPWPQKGDAVALPLGTSAPVASDAAAAAALVVWDGANYVQMDSSTPTLTMTGTAGTEGNRLYADLSIATGATINELRQSFQVQKMLERDARGGTRYIEILKAHFGVTSPDARLQRPEYLGGGSSPVSVTPVAQTSESAAPPTTGDAQGNLAGFGTVAFTGHGFAKSFVEHGVVIGLVNVRADLTYQQGIDRMWSRSTRFDFYWPALAHIGEQAVLRKEIYITGVGATNDDLVFGYQERFAEYRYKPSLVTGLFRGTVSGTLDIWHLAQEFSAAPTLGATFIVDDPPVDRVIAVPTEPHFLFDAYCRLKCARPMPLFGVPGLIDHF